MKRDGAATSIWQYHNMDYTGSLTFPQEDYDVLIVGGGITGLTTALLLQRAGCSCIVAEAHSLCFGSTGGTTAHLNTFVDTPFNMVIKNFGEDNAHLLAQGIKSAITLIKQNIDAYHIDCNLEERTAYLFSTNKKEDKALDDIIDGANKVNVPVGLINDSPFSFPYLRIASWPAQAQFNPVRYVYGLAKAFEELGGVILQDCRVTDVEESEPLNITTTKGFIRARQLVYATHTPPGVNLLHFRAAPYRSYVMAFKLKGEYPRALGYDMSDPYHYYREQEIDGEHFFIAGGEDHKTGHEENTEACFTRLEAHVRTYYEVESVAFRWSSQYFEPADGLPYIGRLPGHTDNIYVATGFGGNGMIYGTLAGLLISNLINNHQSIYEKLFNPSRIKPVAGFSNVVKEAADVIKELVTGKFSAEKIKAIGELAAGEARIVKFEGHTLALYKDLNHQVHAVNPACTHIKCTVAWNSAEKSWDCPCHGSRFSADGVVLTAPARRDLDKHELFAEEEQTAAQQNNIH